MAATIQGHAGYVLRAARARPRTARQSLGAPMSAFDCSTPVLRGAALPGLLVYVVHVMAFC